jgi:hypothetical protein
VFLYGGKANSWGCRNDAGLVGATVTLLGGDDGDEEGVQRGWEDRLVARLATARRARVWAGTRRLLCGNNGADVGHIKRRWRGHVGGDDRNSDEDMGVTYV